MRTIYLAGLLAGYEAQTTLFNCGFELFCIGVKKTDCSLEKLKAKYKTKIRIVPLGEVHNSRYLGKDYLGRHILQPAIIQSIGE